MEKRREAFQTLPLGDTFTQMRAFAHLIKSEPALGLPISSSLSFKAGYPTVFGSEAEGLFFLKTAPAASPATDQETWLRNDILAKLASLADLSEPQLGEQIQLSRLIDSPWQVPASVLLHAVIPARVVAITHPAALLIILQTNNAQQRLSAIYGESLLVVEQGISTLSFAYRVSTGFAFAPGCIGVVIPDCGVVVFGETPEAAWQNLNQIVARAEHYLEEHHAALPALDASAEPDQDQLKAIPAMRQALSDAAGFPMIVSLDKSNLARHYARRASTGTESVETALRVQFDPRLGALCTARTAQSAAEVKSINQASMAIALRASVLGEAGQSDRKGYIPQDDVLLDQRSMTGEVALVTGAASGIGKACVESFLQRGAAVVGLDINPAIEDLFPQPGYLGMCVDLTDEDGVRSVLMETIIHFGGLDMLVLNAGIFPTGCRIDSLSLEVWDKVRRINLDANLVLMREAFPLLKVAPRNGRVVIVGSRNQRAPGPGAAAYSVSKAAVTQLARVAALEWGADQIRVNVIHPDSVFDTALYTDEILKSRSAMYGMTVEQYKRRNVLKVEITSRDISEMAAEMCGPLFAKVTGAQIPLDGGNERVI